MFESTGSFKINYRSLVQIMGVKLKVWNAGLSKLTDTSDFFAPQIRSCPLNFVNLIAIGRVWHGISQKCYMLVYTIFWTVTSLGYEQAATTFTPKTYKVSVCLSSVQLVFHLTHSSPFLKGYGWLSYIQIYLHSQKGLKNQ